MNKEFIPYEQALALKELGFDIPYYFATYLDSFNLIPREEEDGWDLSKGIIAPLYQQAFRWFREKHHLYHSIDPLGFSMCLGKVGELGSLLSCNTHNYGIYEEAELACLKKLIEIVKNK